MSRGIRISTTLIALSGIVLIVGAVGLCAETDASAALELLRERIGKAAGKDEEITAQFQVKVQAKVLRLMGNMVEVEFTGPFSTLGKSWLDAKSSFGGREKVEDLLKDREYRPPEDEEAPEEFRELVERYFRALSED